MVLIFNVLLLSHGDFCPWILPLYVFDVGQCIFLLFFLILAFFLFFVFFLFTASICIFAYILLGWTCWFSRFLVGEGARLWAQSKGISMPKTTKESDEVRVVVIFQLKLLFRFHNAYICFRISGWWLEEPKPNGRSLKLCWMTHSRRGTIMLQSIQHLMYQVCCYCC